MVAAVSPGIFIQERDDSLYAPAFSPTIMGLVGTATKGPLDTARLVTNENQLVDVYGRPRTKDLGMQAAIEALKAGRLVYFIRIAGASASKGQVDVNDTGSGATAASIGPSQAEPFNLLSNAVETTPGDPTEKEAIIQFDYNNGAGVVSNAQVEFTAARATVTSGTTETYDFNAIDSGNPVTLTIRINAGVVQTITFDSTDPLISNFAAVTAEEVAAVINDQLIGGGATVDGAGTSVIVFSDRYGAGSSVQITGGNANDMTNGLDFSTAVVSGTGTQNLSDLSAVTGAEVKTVVEADVSVGAGDILVSVGVNGEVTFQTATTGSTRTITIDSAPSTAIGASPLINVTPLDTVVSGTDATASSPTVRFTAKEDGSWSDRLDVRITASSALAGTVKLDVLLDNVVVETYDKLFKSPTPVSGGLALITTINSGSPTDGILASEFITASDLNATGENPESGTHSLSAGNNGDDWTAGDVVGTITAGIPSGLQIFRDPDNIFINILATPGISYSAVIAEKLDICATRGDCMAVIDAPQGLTPQQVVDWHNGDSSITVTVDQEGRTETNSTTFNSSYGALYYPFVQVFDKFNPTGGTNSNGRIFIPPSAIILRTIAFTDNTTEPWFAPAGPVRTQASSVLDIETNTTQGEQDLMQLDPFNAVNPIRSLDGVGIVIMGQKTLLRAPSALNRVNVRRLLLAIEKVIADSVLFLLFEQNDAVMWRRFIKLVTPLMEDVKARRGVFDFRIIADSSTTTPALIDQNTFVGKIFLQPIKSAEKLIIPFNLVPSGANFQEFAQA